MRYIKTYEYYNMKYHIPYFENDYALFKYTTELETYQNQKLTPELKEFINSNIGFIQYISIAPGTNWISVIYDNIPDNLKEFFYYNNSILLNKDNIFLSSRTKEDLEIKMKADKYNI